MEKIIGNVIDNPDTRRPFRAVIMRGGKVIAYQDARTMREARRFLAVQLQSATMAEKRCGSVARRD